VLVGYPEQGRASSIAGGGISRGQSERSSRTWCFREERSHSAISQRT
jgi:hypothetical protein